MKHIIRLLIGSVILAAIVAVCMISTIQIILGYLVIAASAIIVVYGIGYALSPDNNDQ